MQPETRIAISLRVILTVRRPANWFIFTLYRIACFLNLLPKEVTIPYLDWMLEEIVKNSPNWDVDKTNRWIGYVQGVLVAIGLTTVTAERDRVRKLKFDRYEN